MLWKPAGLTARHYVPGSLSGGLKVRYFWIAICVACSGAAAGSSGAPTPPALRSGGPSGPPIARPLRAPAQRSRAITVSVASSLTDVLADLGHRYEASTGVHVRVNAGASSSLARQIVEGAPVDLFISADQAQMDVVAKAGRLVSGSRTSLLSNRLVIVVPRASTMRCQEVEVTGPADLANPAVRRITMGQPESVPAGVYGRHWLQNLGLWNSVQPKVVPLPTVRAALAAVVEGRADAAIVYATDARTSGGVVVVHEAQGRDVPLITYPAAVVAGAREADAAQFLTYLQSDEARGVFTAAGFSVRDVSRR